MSSPDRADGPAPLAHARAIVAAFVPSGAEQEEAQRRILEFVDVHPDALLRTCAEGHLTGSALVVGTDGRVLLMHHRKLGMWLQMGGHADGVGDLAEVALREAEEESGIAGLQLVSGAPVDVDVHRVDPPGEPAHFHLDVRYAALAPAGAVPVANRESLELRWFRPEEAEPRAPSMVRLVEAALAATTDLG